MKKLIIGLLTIIGIVFTACNDDFLEKYPQTDLTEENSFLSYDNYRYFMYPCYEMFNNTNIQTAVNGYGANSIFGPVIWGRRADIIVMRFRVFLLLHPVTVGTFNLFAVSILCFHIWKTVYFLQKKSVIGNQ